MSNTQQEVLIYKESMLRTAQRKFERDLAKRQREGWKLISITPTNKAFGRISHLTAIYERVNLYHDNIPSYTPYVPHPYEQTPLLFPEVPSSPSKSSEQPSLSTVVQAYSKTIFLGLLTTTVISILLIGLSSNATAGRFLVFVSGAGMSLFLGVLSSIFIMDWKGFVSLEGLIRWKQMEGKKLIGMGCLFFFFFPIFFFIYLVLVGWNVLQSEGPVFSKKWNAPKPIKQRAKIGLVTGTIIALISFVFATSTYATSTNVENVSTTDRTPPATTAAVTNTSHSTPQAPVATPKPTQKPKPTAQPNPTASAAQIEADYKASTTDTSIANLDKNGNTDQGNDVHFTCTIVAFVKDSLGNTAGTNVTDTSSGSFVQVIFTPGTDITQLNTQDILEVWGSDQGVSSGTNAFGGTVQEVVVQAKYMNDQTTRYKADS